MKRLLLAGVLPLLSCVADRDAGVAASELEVSAAPIVTTVEGALRGDRDGDVIVFRGISYAQPPVGVLRFRPPQPVEPWRGTRAARRFGPPCPQRGENGASEDCLALNVWAPASAGRRPVMVFFHGGGFTRGSSDNKVYDATQLVQTGDVVVVTVNYRLGALGYLATEALARESGDGSAGNYGLRDQIAALQWVHRNIAAFGGDPGMVTMFGESAGAISVCALLGSTLADGLYQRAIMESGACNGFEPLRASGDRPSIIERGEALASAVGCGRLAPPSCLRDDQITWQTLVEAQDSSELHRTLLGSLEFAPAIDGVMLREDPLARLARGDVAVPILVGSNFDEARAFTIVAGKPVDTFYTWDAFDDHVRAIFGPVDGERVISIYPRAEYPESSGPNRAYLTLVTDYTMACPTISIGEATAPRSSTYIYSFNRALDGRLGSLGATHAIELLFVFGNFPPLYSPTLEDQAVTTDMQRAWTSFAHDGAPLLVPDWPRYDPADPHFALLDSPATISTEIRAGRCRQLRSLGLVP